MIQFDDAAEMERRASMYFGDGLLDIGIGIGLFVLGFGMVFGVGALAVVYMAVLFSIVRSAKRSITVPRMHHLDFIPEPGSESRQRRNKAVLVSSLVVLLAIGVLALFMSKMMPARISAGVRANGIVIFGGSLAGLFTLVGWGTATKRPWAYAAISMLALVLGYWFNLKVSWYLMLLGAVVVAWGAAVLARFVRDYPRFHHRDGGVYQRTY
jgi:hypothetical protein